MPIPFALALRYLIFKIHTAGIPADIDTKQQLGKFGMLLSSH